MSGRTKTSKEAASEILRIIPHAKAFYFFIDIGQYIGKSALSLVDFREKIRTVELKSVEFHFKRRDFEEWIREIVGDAQLAAEIGRIKRTTQGEELREKIHQAVDERLTALKKIAASKKAYLERT